MTSGARGHRSTSRHNLALSRILAVVVAGSLVSHAAGAAHPAAPSSAPNAYRDALACQVKSIQKYPEVFEGMAKSPISDLYLINKKDATGTYQLYTGKAGSSERNCISCTERSGVPRVDRHKMMTTWHPSGQWVIVGVEADTHDNMWMPRSWQEGFMQAGIWLNMWATTPTGDRWYQLTKYQPPATGPSNGFVGTPFSPDGKKAVWAEIVDGNIFLNKFGVWKLFAADFVVDASGAPVLTNKKDITPPGAQWVEPGSFAPDGRHVLLSADIGLDDAQGQDQWTLDIVTGSLKQLTDSPGVWDEHGLYSPSGNKVVFMSSYPYRNEPGSYKTESLKTEFMLMNADGSQLQQLTHFNVPGYPESQKDRTIAAVAGFIGEGSQMLATIMGPDFTKVAWVITFQGVCGAS